ncbi:alpha/beta hydrolase [Massilia solisilvae]|uniref:Alpha/beta hydrolase n=1 Tax=Massilia solisilvae TaxID=1811225 RepID=A0ABT2BGT4_9BURK|nr:alpha/beta hydrolase [Massilia solisilvae]MCS0607642.1 alpha/beta hydrolase [Massilia solisilvae]
MGSQLQDFRVLVAPGLGGSGAGHWQTRWQTLHPWFERIGQRDWDCPDLLAWSAQVGDALRRSARPAIVVAHSFGCLATVHRIAAGVPQLAGALLVAPADPAKFGVQHELAVGPLPVPSVVVGSENDPWLSAGGARDWSARWGSEFVNAGALGHINAESRLGDWPFGLALLEMLAARAALER